MPGDLPGMLSPLGGPAATVFRVDDPSQVGEVRRAADALAARARLSETERGTLAIVVTEAASNVARHAPGGRILLDTVGEPGAAGVELLALDNGPGIANVGRAMEDGFSSAGTPGHGLGAIRRMAGDFDLYSRHGGGQADVGTMMLARVWSAAAARRRAAGAPRMEVGAVCVALAGERDCGDSWVVLAGRDRTLVAIADGLGHGAGAAAASTEAIRVVRESPDASPAELVQAAHGPLRATRGAAMAVAVVDHDGGIVTFAGIGNIAAGIHAADGTRRSLASHNGTVGHVVRTVQEFRYDMGPGGVLLMHSDGINTRWRLDAYPGLLHHDPALVAGAIYRDAARGRDDATVVALRGRPAAPDERGLA